MKVDPQTASFQEVRDFLGEVIASNPNSKKVWDLMTGLRGPDSPSEVPSMSGKERADAYDARRVRKAVTVEVIRGHAFGGIVGGQARSRTDRDWVELPPESEWDHFDRHVDRTARVLGLGVKIIEPEKEAKWAVEAKVKVDGGKVKKKNQTPTTNTYFSTSVPSPYMKALKEKKEKEDQALTNTKTMTISGSYTPDYIVYNNLTNATVDFWGNQSATLGVQDVVPTVAPPDWSPLAKPPVMKLDSSLQAVYDSIIQTAYENAVKKEAPSANTLSEDDIPF
jgi:hypothetical protein